MGYPVSRHDNDAMEVAGVCFFEKQWNIKDYEVRGGIFQQERFSRVCDCWMDDGFERSECRRIAENTVAERDAIDAVRSG